MTGLMTARPLAGSADRAHNPRWACAATSGERAALHGGRFKPLGTTALYTALDPKTAWMEAQQGIPFKARPSTLVAYRADCECVVELADPLVLSAVGITLETLGCPWEVLAARGMTPPTWDLARTLIHAGRHGIVVPSFAPGTGDGGRNLVLWRWADAPPCRGEQYIERVFALEETIENGFGKVRVGVHSGESRVMTRSPGLGFG